jgi:alpha-galactosidase
MTGEMLEKQRAYLPQFKKRRLRAVPEIRVPKKVLRKEVPLDPALAIANRFGTLAKA